MAATTETPERTTCPICEKRAVLRKSGKMANHPTSSTPGAPNCRGGGLTVNDATARTDSAIEQAHAKLDALGHNTIGQSSPAEIREAIGDPGPDEHSPEITVAVTSVASEPPMEDLDPGLNLKKVADLLSLQSRLPDATNEDLNRWGTAAKARLATAKGTSAPSRKVQDQLRELITNIEVLVQESPC